MVSYKRNNEAEPFRGEEDYKVAHDYEPELFTYLLDTIEQFTAYEHSPTLQRSFHFYQDGSHTIIESRQCVDDGADTSCAFVSSDLHITQVNCKLPQPHSALYNVRLSTRVKGVNNPITTEYYLEKLLNGTYFGTMRRLAFGGVHEKQSNPADFGVLEDMTVYDIIELDSALQEHLYSIEQEAAISALIMDK